METTVKIIIGGLIALGCFAAAYVGATQYHLEWGAFGFGFAGFVILMVIFSIDHNGKIEIDLSPQDEDGE